MTVSPDQLQSAIEGRVIVLQNDGEVSRLVQLAGRLGRLHLPDPTPAQTARMTSRFEDVLAGRGRRSAFGWFGLAAPDARRPFVQRFAAGALLLAAVGGSASVATGVSPAEAARDTLQFIGNAIVNLGPRDDAANPPGEDAPTPSADWGIAVGPTSSPDAGAASPASTAAGTPTAPSAQPGSSVTAATPTAGGATPSPTGVGATPTPTGTPWSSIAPPTATPGTQGPIQPPTPTKTPSPATPSAGSPPPVSQPATTPTGTPTPGPSATPTTDPTATPTPPSPSPTPSPTPRPTPTEDDGNDH